MLLDSLKATVLKFIIACPGASIEAMRTQLMLTPADMRRALKALEADVEQREGKYFPHVAHPIEKWYSGKQLQLIRNVVLPTLAQAQQDGCWPKGASRMVTAALNKQAVAQRFAQAHTRDRNFDRGEALTGMLDDINDVRPHWHKSTLRGRDFIHAMRFGNVYHAPQLVELGMKLVPCCVNEVERRALQTARQWAADFAPIAAAMELLDARRAPPVIMLGSLSPSVAKNIGDSLGIKFDTIQVPPIKGEWVEVEIAGVPTQIVRYTIEWPEGTQHNRSRFAHGSRAGNDQCHACGHAIKQAFNWVPLMADGPTGKLALWVGRDCARKLFAVDVKGDGQFLRGGLS